MLVVRIELWPHGDESRRKIIASGTIANTGTGTTTRGNYQVTLFDGNSRRWKSGTVENFPRKRLLGWDLLFRALQMLADRNSENQTKTKRPRN
jgi:hypothetical protein